MRRIEKLDEARPREGGRRIVSMFKRAVVMKALVECKDKSGAEFEIVLP